MPPPKKNRSSTKGSPSIRRPRNLPHKPACREVPPKRKRNTPKSSPSLCRPRGSPSIRRPRGLPQRPAYRQVPKQKKNRYQKAVRISADPAVYLRGRHTGKSKQMQRNAAQNGNKSLFPSNVSALNSQAKPQREFVWGSCRNCPFKHNFPQANGTLSSPVLSKSRTKDISGTGAILKSLRTGRDLCPVI